MESYPLLSRNSSRGSCGFSQPLLDPITDIFRTMHITAFGQHRLEATAPRGLIEEKQTEDRILQLHSS
jgi:hypothetical protein